MSDHVINLRVTANSVQGHRKYMEDCYKIRFQRDKSGGAGGGGGHQDTGDPQSDVLFSYFGIFDGHGGKEASQFAKERLYWKIVELDDFWSDDDKRVLAAIRNGFVQCHMDMWNELPKWPKTPAGLPSTSGSTATVLFIKKSKAYVGHVGDSGLVIGYARGGHSGGPWRGEKLTRDHKPEDPVELKRIESCGGSVVNKSGINRVVWNRPVLPGNPRGLKTSSSGSTGGISSSTGRMTAPTEASTTGAVPTEKIPFLAVARSLGDLWSYDRLHDEFVVSPVPDVFSFDIDPRLHKCLVLATDGLWNVMKPNECVEQVRQTDRETESLVLRSSGPASAAAANSTMAGQTGASGAQPFVNPSQRLVQAAFQRCCERSLRSDNITCITIMVDEPHGQIRSSNKQLERLMQERTLGASQIEDSDTECAADEVTISAGDCTKMARTFASVADEDEAGRDVGEFETPGRSRSMISLRRRRWSASSARSVSAVTKPEPTATGAGSRRFVNADDREQNRIFVEPTTRSRRQKQALNCSSNSSSLPSLKLDETAPAPAAQSRRRPEQQGQSYNARYARSSQAFTNMNLNSTSASIHLRRHQHTAAAAKKSSLNTSSASAFLGINKLSKSLRKSFNDVYSKENAGKSDMTLPAAPSLANKFGRRLKGFKDRIKNNLKRKLFDDKSKSSSSTAAATTTTGPRKSKSAYEFSAEPNIYEYRERSNEEDEEDDEPPDDYEDEENHYEEPDETRSKATSNQSFVEHFKSKLGYLKRPRGANKSSSSLVSGVGGHQVMTRSATAAAALGAKPEPPSAFQSKRPKFY